MSNRIRINRVYCTFFGKYFQLLQNELKRRKDGIHVPRVRRVKTNKFLSDSVPDASTCCTEPPPVREKRQRCYHCIWLQDRKVKSQCSMCSRSVCNNHGESRVICTLCEDASKSSIKTQSIKLS